MWRLEIRRSPAFPSLVVLVAAGWAMTHLRMPVAIGVPPALGNAISVSVIVMGPVAGACCAFAAARRLSSLSNGRALGWARSDAAVRAGTLLPMLAATVLAYLLVALAATVTSVTFNGAWPWPSYVLLGLGALLAHSALGALAGVVAPSPRATPIVVLAALLLLGRLIPIPLSGPVYLTPDARAVAAYLAVGVALWAVALWAPVSPVTARRSPPPRVLAVAATLALLGPALAVTAGTGSTAQLLRDPDGKAVCDGGVCVWAEHSDHLPALTAARERLAELHRHGFAAPPRFAEAGLPQPESLEVITWSGGPAGLTLPPDWLAMEAMAREVKSRTTGDVCPPKDASVADAFTVASWSLTAWLTRVAASSSQPGDLHGGPPIDVAAIDRLREQPLADQLAWADEQVRILTASPCTW